MSERPNFSVHAPGAFTLIEVIAVIVIIALLAGLAGFSLKGVLRHADGEQVAQRILAYDGLARQRAERFDQGMLLDIRPNRIEQASAERPEALASRDVLPTVSPPLVLPTGWAIDRVVSADGTDIRQEIRIDATAGGSRTYGLRLVDAEGQHRWIIVCGPTGMGMVVNDDRQAENILAILSRARLPRLDAD